MKYFLKRTKLVDPTGVEPVIFSLQTRRITINALSPKLVDTIVALTVDSNHGREVLPPLLNKLKLEDDAHKFTFRHRGDILF